MVSDDEAPPLEVDNLISWQTKPRQEEQDLFCPDL